MVGRFLCRSEALKLVGVCLFMEMVVCKTSFFNCFSGSCKDDRFYFQTFRMPFSSFAAFLLVDSSFSGFFDPSNGGFS